jgi:putative transposase
MRLKNPDGRLLERMNDARAKGVKLRTYDTQNMIPSPKLKNPKLNMVYSKVLQMVNYILWSNIKGLSASKKNGRKIGHNRATYKDLQQVSYITIGSTSDC